MLPRSRLVRRPHLHGEIWETVRRLPRRFSRRPDARTVTVRLRGDIDASNADHVAQRLSTALRTAPGTIEIDLTRVIRITPNGSTALLVLARSAQERGTAVVIRNASGQPRAALHSVGLDRFLTYRSGSDAGGA